MRAFFVVASMFITLLAGCTGNGHTALHESPSSGAWAIEHGTLVDNTTLAGHDVTDRFTYNLTVSDVHDIVDGWGRVMPGYDVNIAVQRLQREGDTYRIVDEEATRTVRLGDGSSVALRYADGVVITARDPAPFRPQLYAAWDRWDEAGRPVAGETQRTETVDFFGTELTFEVVTSWSRPGGVLPYACSGTAVGIDAWIANAAAVEKSLEERTGSEVTVYDGRPVPGTLPRALVCFDEGPAAAWAWTYSGNTTWAHVRGDEVPALPVDGSPIPDVPDRSVSWSEVAGPTGEVVRVPGSADDPWAGWMHPVAEGWHVAADPASVWFAGAAPGPDGALVLAADGEVSRGYAMPEVIDGRYIRGSAELLVHEFEVPDTIAEPAALDAALAPWKLDIPERPMLVPVLQLFGGWTLFWALGHCDDSIAFVDAEDGHLDAVLPGDEACGLMGDGVGSAALATKIQGVEPGLHDIRPPGIAMPGLRVDLR